MNYKAKKIVNLYNSAVKIVGKDINFLKSEFKNRQDVLDKVRVN